MVLFPCLSFNSSGITIHLPFKIIPSITDMSSRNVQYILMSCGIWSLISGQPGMICSLRHSTCDVASCSSCIVMQYGKSVIACMALKLNHMSGISVFFFSFLICLESQSTTNKSGPGLYTILTMYWCILRRIHCSLSDNVVISFFEYCYEWFVICDYTHLSHKVVMKELFEAI